MFTNLRTYVYETKRIRKSNRLSGTLTGEEEVLKYLKKYWYCCLLAPMFMLGEIAMDLVQPELMSTIVDEGVLSGVPEVVLRVGLQMTGLVIFGGACGVLSGVFANLAAQRFGNDLRKELFRKVMDADFVQTDELSTGSLVTRITNDVAQVQNMVMMSIRSLVRCTVMFAGGIFMLYLQSPTFALIAACVLPVVAFFIVFFLKKASPMFGTVQKRLDDVNNVLQENVQGARVVKAFVKEEGECKRFGKANDALCSINLKVQTLLSFLQPIMNITLNLCVVAVIYVGGVQVDAGASVTPGEIMAAITYLAMIMHGLMFMANISQTFTRAAASAKRIREVLSLVPSGAGGDVKESKEKGTIEFRNVSFSYAGSQRRALDDVSFKVNKGETVAIIGSTGSGKTSIVNLIPRFYDASSGEVLVGGLPVKEYDVSALREIVALAPQRVELFSRTMEANIRFGRPSATDREVKDAAITAQADEFIMSKAGAYYSGVTERGRSLSGGQRQRISLARSVIKNAEVLVLDDSTGALDLKTEAAFYGALKEDYAGLTKIIVAQRIASISDADRIIVLDKGRVAAEGTHEQLMECSKLYREIYDSQMKEEEN